MTRYLIFLRPEECRGTTSEALSKAAGISRADANRAIRSNIPKSIAVSEDPEEAKFRIRALREAGLHAVAVSQEAMHAFAPTPVLSATKGDGGMFWNTKDEPVWLGTDDVRMIIVGKIHEKTVTQEASRYKAPYDMLLSEYSSSSETRPTSDVKITRQSMARFILLFCGSGGCYFVQGDGFDFHSTLGYRCNTRKKSFDALLRIIRENHPAALQDDSLYNHPQAIRSFEKSFKRDGLALVAESASRVKTGSTGDRMMMLAYLKYATALAGKD
jgi:hypothetical protein